MAQIKVTDTLDGLFTDMATVARSAQADMQKVVNEGARTGASLARDNARRTAGKHGKRYPRSITAEAQPRRGAFGVGFISAEYGPDAAKAQGNMSFEYGSRNQPPHLDLAKSADVVGPALAGEARRLLDRWFWPGGES